MSLETLLAQGEAWLASLKSHLSPAVQAEIKTVQNEGHAVVAAVETGALTIEQQIVAMGYPMLIQDALELVTGALTGSPWATLVGTLIKTAENQGHTLVATAADAALNLAKAKLVVAGTVAPVTPTPVAA